MQTCHAFHFVSGFEDKADNSCRTNVCGQTKILAGYPAITDIRSRYPVQPVIRMDTEFDIRPDTGYKKNIESLAEPDII